MTLQSKGKLIQGMSYREWQDLIVLVHKAQIKREKSNGIMDKIIEKAVIWTNLDELEEKIREVCFKFD